METPASGDVTAIITARGGSKGLPGKNIRLLLGKPVIEYTIEAAIKADTISQCFVSTEDQTIKEISIQAGAEIIDRPTELATDVSTSEEVVLHALKILKALNRMTKYFVLLQPTSPLRNAEDIDNCVRAFKASGASSSASLCEVEHHPYKSFEIGSSGLKPLFDFGSLTKRRQDLPKVYRHNGAIYCLESEVFLKNSSFFVEPILPYVMSQEKSVDIDSANDLLICERALLHG